MALAEMALASGIGIRLEKQQDMPPHGYWFGEDQGCYVVAIDEQNAHLLLDSAASQKIDVKFLGVAAGRDIVLEGEEPLAVRMVKQAHESWLPEHMV